MTALFMLLLAAAPAPLEGAFAQCAARAHTDLNAAARCYEALAAPQPGDDDAVTHERARARALSALARKLEAPATAAGPLAQAEAGRLELVATAGVAGATAAWATAAAGLTAAGLTSGPQWLGTGALAVVAGGLFGTAAGAVGAVLTPSATEGQSHLVRAGLTLGMVNAAAVLVAAPAAVPQQLVAGGLVLAGAGAGLCAAQLPLPAAAGPLALSGMLMGGGAGFLGARIAGADAPWTAAATVLGASAAAVGAAAAAPLLPLSRAETWFMDAGALGGGVAAFALATAAHAPTPLLGYGATAGGMVLGAVAGVATAKLAPAALDALFRDTLTGVTLAPAVDARGGWTLQARGRL